MNEARVLAVGPGGLDKDGKRVACGVAVGDKVLIPQVRGSRVLYWTEGGGEERVRR